MGQRKSRLHEHIFCLFQRQLKGKGKCDCSRLARFIQLVAADLREELAVNIGLLIALSVRHAGLINFPQQHL